MSKGRIYGTVDDFKAAADEHDLHTIEVAVPDTQGHVKPSPEAIEHSWPGLQTDAASRRKAHL